MILIIDYGMGNIGSIENMVRKAGGSPIVSDLPETVEKASKIILPGVGAFDEGVKHLKERGLWDVLDRRIQTEKIPFLGICLGMQLCTERSEEGQLRGFGWLDAETVRFTPGDSRRVPHMGWNEVAEATPSPLFAGLAKARFYFVHSYHVRCRKPEDIAANSTYGDTFPAAVCHGNIFGTQFHPEKSHRFGLQLIENFLTRC